MVKIKASYSALGNVYVVAENKALPAELTPFIQEVCRQYAADGVLLDRGWDSEKQCFAVTILNPDGSVAENSGNGTRIFAWYLFEQRRVSLHQLFSVHTGYYLVNCRILHTDLPLVEANLGVPVFTTPFPDELQVEDRVFEVGMLSVGNPHCVVLNAPFSEREVKIWGPKIERHARFPSRTNVQFVQSVTPLKIDIRIWERGAGYTLSSGSSSVAAAAVLHRLGRCAAEVTVVMPGGEAQIKLTAEGAWLQSKIIPF